MASDSTYMMTGMLPRSAPGKPSDMFAFIRVRPLQDPEASEMEVKARMASVLELIKSERSVEDDEEYPDSPIVRSETSEEGLQVHSKDSQTSAEREQERTVKMLKTIRQLDEQIWSNRGIRRGSGSRSSSPPVR